VPYDDDTARLAALTVGKVAAGAQRESMIGARTCPFWPRASLSICRWRDDKPSERCSRHPVSPLVTSRGEPGLEPTVRFSRNRFGCVPLRSRRPRTSSSLVPFRICERIAAFVRPSIISESPLAQCCAMRGNRRTVVDRARRVVGRQLVQRSHSPTSRELRMKVQTRTSLQTSSTDFARVGAIYGPRGTNNSLVDRTSTFSNARPVSVVWWSRTT